MLGCLLETGCGRPIGLRSCKAVGQRGRHTCTCTPKNIHRIWKVHNLSLFVTIFSPVLLSHDQKTKLKCRITIDTIVQRYYHPIKRCAKFQAWTSGVKPRSKKGPYYLYFITLDGRTILWRFEKVSTREKPTEDNLQHGTSIFRISILRVSTATARVKRIFPDGASWLNAVHPVSKRPLCQKANRWD